MIVTRNLHIQFYQEKIRKFLILVIFYFYIKYLSYLIKNFDENPKNSTPILTL